MSNIFLKYVTLATIFLLFYLQLSAQNKRTNNWYFGYFAGINFNNNPPDSLTDGMLNTEEGCATISDENGDLMFYTDGTKVYNREHDTMLNGTGLFGSTTSTQSSIIVPYPGSDNLYYIFTVDGPFAGTEHGLCYSIVDMNLNNKLGDVMPTNKNIRLTDTLYPTEKLTAVTHANRTDIWVIAHEWGTSSFYSYKITDKGVDTNAIISTVGTSHGTAQNSVNISKGTGYLKVSPDGTKLALAILGSKVVEVLNFDNNTGVVSTSLMKNIFSKMPYGVEFSPDGTKVYFATVPRKATTSEYTFIYQYNLSVDSIAASKTLVATSGDKIHHFGALQLAPDGKIYVARYNKGAISVIANPNILGTACEFKDSAIVLGGNGKCKFGLPNFIQSSIIEEDTTITTTTKPPSEKECESCISSFAPEPGKKYVINAWVKEENALLTKTSFNYPKIIIYYQGGFIPKDIVPFTAKGNIIDGWQRIQEEFSIPADATDIFIQLTCSTGDCFFDDIRIHPFDATMQSFVYDPVTLKLSAILDENNYATFYEYDEEGKLIRLKKETERGIMTIKENRNSLIK